MSASARSTSSEESSDSGGDYGRNRAARGQALTIQDRSTTKRKRADTSERLSNRPERIVRMGSEDPDGDDSDAYDPDQPMEERRKIQRGFRDLQKDLADNMEEYMQPGSRGLQKTLLRAQELSDQVKQTSEATIDSRLLVTTVDMSYRKTLRLVQGGNSQGVDVDEFVSKCITYMRHGGGIADDDAPTLSSTQRSRRSRNDRSRGGGGDDDDEDDEMFNWPHLGRFACLPTIRRPALTGFLIGPLSVEKKARRVAKRAAPFRKDDLAEVRPEVLSNDELNKKENDVAAICARILKRLIDFQSRAQTELSRIIEEKDMSSEEATRLMHEAGLRDTGGVDLLKFVVNPRSFGQTVENMFYISFLIRDGKVDIDFDQDELPTLSPKDTHDEEGAPSKTENAKHQAIFSMDMQTWKDIIDAFDIKEPIIEHRRENTHQGPGARGWYS